MADIGGRQLGLGPPPIVMQNGIEFVSTAEAAKRLGIDARTISYHVQQGHIKPLRIPGIRGSGRRPPHYFRAADLLRLPLREGEQ